MRSFSCSFSLLPLSSLSVLTVTIALSLPSRSPFSSPSPLCSCSFSPPLSSPSRLLSPLRSRHLPSLCGNLVRRRQRGLCACVVVDVHGLGAQVVPEGLSGRVVLVARGQCACVVGVVDLCPCRCTVHAWTSSCGGPERT